MLGLTFLVASLLHAQFDSAKATRILQAVDELLTFKNNDFSAELKVEQSIPGGGSSTTLAALFRRDRKDQFLILVLEPDVDKGKGYLKTGDGIWLYDPVGRRYTFSSARERFQSSSAQNSDFSRSNLSKDYFPVDSEFQKLGVYDCEVITLKAVSDSVPYPKMKIWVSADGLLRKYEDYSLSGALMRTTAIPGYQKIGGAYVPSTMVILDHLKSKEIDGKKQYATTKVSIGKVSLAALGDIVFTKEYLEKVNK